MKKDYPRLYGTLYAIGVNSVLWIDGENQTEVELERIATQRDMSQIDPSRRPLLNPSLELSGIYFMQELRRPVKAEEHKNIRELEEELIANLRKSRIPDRDQCRAGRRRKASYSISEKQKKDKIMQPVLTDVWNLRNLEEGRISELQK